LYQGIFFSSRVARRFKLHANGHVLIVDAPLDDVALLAELHRRDVLQQLLERVAAATLKLASATPRAR
jgi:hypothetical protein